MVESTRGLIENEILSLDGVKVMASNVTERMRRLQLTLQSPPLAPTPTNEGPPVVAGYLYMQKNMGEWKQLWCEFSEGELTYRNELGCQTIGGRIPVSFCETELVHDRCLPEFKTSPTLRPTVTAAVSGSASPVLQPTASPLPRSGSTLDDIRTRFSVDLTRSEEMYYSSLGIQAKHSFKVFSPVRTYVFRADSDYVRDEFCKAMFDWLKAHLDENAFGKKLEALKEVNPVIREQFLIHDNHYNQLILTLSKSGFLEDELPITSTRKEKCGVLSMEVASEEVGWKDYYFVLFEGTLFYYKDSKSTAPTGILTLKYASVDVDPIGLTKGDFKFEVKTPLRTVVCRAKHAIALAEWIASLDGALNSHVKKFKGPKRTSMEVLKDIDEMILSVATFRTMATAPSSLRAFKSFLGEHAAVQLDFVLAVDELRSRPVGFETQRDATAIYNKFFGSEREMALDQHRAIKLPADTWTAVKQMTQREMLDEAMRWCEKPLEASFAGFKETTTYQSLSFFGEGVVANPSVRRITNFERDSVQSFLLKVKGSKKSLEIKLSPKKDVLTIGRDKSNSLVVEDSRVSRSHARVEYTDTQCEYIDLGSSCGSKLNGKPVLRAKLQPGDVVEIGQSTLIFQIGKRGRFSLRGFP
jgi:hypothetical protein